MNWSDQIRRMNGLHELLADGRKGYEEAAENVEDPKVAEMLGRLGKQRELMQDEVAAEIQRFKPDDRLSDGTVKGALHRTWIEIRQALGSADGTTLLDECERGENHLVERYDAVLNDPGIAPSSKRLLTTQRRLVQENLNLVKALRNNLLAVEK